MLTPARASIDADICVIATHKEPETTIARSMGLKPGSTGALVVNERMETSMAGVYAAGDVVEVPQNLTGIAVQGLTGSHAMQQGRRGRRERRRREPPLRPGEHPVGDGRRADRRSAGRAWASTWPESLGIPYVVGTANGISRARYFPGVQQVRVKLAGGAGHGRLIGGQFVGGEGIKERADFLAFALKRGATLEDLAWMENVYSPPIGALYEPLSVAAQNGMAQL